MVAVAKKMRVVMVVGVWNKTKKISFPGVKSGKNKIAGNPGSSILHKPRKEAVFLPEQMFDNLTNLVYA